MQSITFEKEDALKNKERFELYPCHIPGDFYQVALHYQDSCEIIYIKKGLGQVRMDNHEYRAKAGDIFFLPPGTLHGIRQYLNYDLEYENLFFSKDFLPSNEIAGILVSEGNRGHSEMSYILNRMEQLSKFRRSGYEIGIQGLFLSFYYELLQQDHPASPDKRSSFVNKRMNKMISYIEANYLNRLTVDMIANEMGISSAHFMKLFKEETGESFLNYIIDKRLDYAAGLLETTDDKIVEVAEKSGYDNLSNFNRQFKRKFQANPRDYRKKSRDIKPSIPQLS